MGSSSDQAKIWGPAARDWMNNVEPRNHVLWHAMLDFLKPLEGKVFLDAGCGAGGASVFAAESGAKIYGIDATPEFIELCKARVPNGEFVTGDLEELPYADEFFDAILASNSVQFTYDPAQALSEFKRVLKPDGRAAVAIFTEIERNDNGLIYRALASLRNEPPRVGPFALSAPRLLDSAIEKAGLKIVHEAEEPINVEYEDEDHFWRGQSSSGPAKVLIAKFGEQTVRETAFNAVKHLMAPDGRIHMKNLSRVAVLTR